MQQVSPVYFNIQLDEIPDSFHRLSVKDTEGNTFYEVDNFARISEQSYYVDYNNGIVYFHHTKGATVVNVTYYGRGFKLIRSSRIVMEDGAKLADILSSASEAKSVHSTENNTQEKLDKLFELIEAQQKQIDYLTNEVKSLTINVK